MNHQPVEDLDEYYMEASRWSGDREVELAGSRRVAWIMAAIAAAIALAEAVALIMLMPLKTVVPYTLLVDRQTGYVEALAPLDQRMVAPDTALTRSLLVQYVIAREGFDIDTLKDNYHKVALWSSGDAQANYVREMQAGNPASPLTSLPRRALVSVQIRSISPLSADSALVRFATVRSDPGGQPQAAQLWVAVLKYHFAQSAMSEADRLVNPLGFQVLGYHRDAEMIAEAPALPGPAAPAPVPQAQPGRYP